MADHKKYSRRAVLTGIIGAGAVGVGAATVIDTEIFPTVKVSYGEVSYEASSVAVDDYQLQGPGINVDEVSVDLTNAASEAKDVLVEVFLSDAGTVIESGSTSGQVPAESDTTITVSIDRVRENEFTQVDIRIEEQ